jgi:hypothetical protein
LRNFERKPLAGRPDSYPGSLPFRFKTHPSVFGKLFAKPTHSGSTHMAQPFKPHTHQVTAWSRFIPDDQWRLYEQVIDAIHGEIPFAIGGAFAVASYTGYWRNTKDLDIYVLPEHRERMIAALTSLGLTDFYEKAPYDRWWIYRSTKDDNIVDVIWAMANHRAQIDELWLSGPDVEIRGRKLRVLPAEAMLWDKLYIMQRDRCDWPDVVNLLYATGVDIDWEYVIGRIGPDVPLLTGALSVFRWLSPGRAAALPPWLWERVGLPKPESAPEIDKRRVDLLDRRPWYGPDREKLQPAA